MTLFVEAPVHRLSRGAGWVLLDLRVRSEVIGNEPAQVIGVIGRIRHDMSDARKPLDQATRLRTIAPLTRRDFEADRQSQRIHGSMDFRRQTAL